MSKKKIGLLSLVFIMVMALVSACGSKDKEVDLGSVSNGVYKNDYFGVTVNLPQDWEVQDAEVMKEIMEVGKDVIADGDETKKKQLDVAELKTLNLLMVSQYPLGEVEPNPNVIVLAEKVSKLQGIKTSKDYLLANKSMVENTGIPYEIGEITSTKIGGKDFDVMVMTIEVDADLTMTQKYYSTILNGYAFSFITTAAGDETIAATDQIVQSAKFE